MDLKKLLCSGDDESPQHRLQTSTLQSNRSDASLSDLVDSTGFLGWGGCTRDCGLDVLLAHLDADSTAIDVGGNKKGSGKRDDDVADGPYQGESGKTWRIEDYESSNNYIKCPGPGRMSFANVMLTFGPAVKPLRPTITSVSNDDDIKNILLQGCHPTANKPMLLSVGNRPREIASVAAGAFDARSCQQSAIKSLFGTSRKCSNASSSSSKDEDKYYSRRSIHLNRKDGVDISELRRELKLAMKESRRNSM